MIKGGPKNKDEIPQGMRTYMAFQDDMAVIDWVILKSRHEVIPETLQRQASEQLHVNHMQIEKNNLLTCESIYWTGINNDIENNIKIVLHVFIFRKHNQRKNCNHEVPGKPWEVVGQDIFILHIKRDFCIADYHSRFPVNKKLEDLSADSLLLPCKIIFFQNMVYQKIMSDAGGNFISDKFKTLCPT